MLSEEQIKHFKEKLVAEQDKLEKELASVGRINPSNPADWEAVPEKLETSKADVSEVADTIEEFENKTAVLRELEIRFNNVKKALENIGKGTYGICSVGGEEIPIERLEANPAALTCVKHATKE